MTIFFSKAIFVLSLNLKIYFTCDRFLLSYQGLKTAILASLGQLKRDIFNPFYKSFQFIWRKQGFNPSEKSFQFVWRKLSCHNWFVTRSKTYHFYFIGHVVWWFLQKPQSKKIVFRFFMFNFSCYYCFMDFKKQSEHSGLCLDTSSLPFLQLKRNLRLSAISE